ncbi:MAG: type II CAAX prenyl endopeptidase Rce1 family protein [Halanaerobiaceae bacterium]
MLLHKKTKKYIHNFNYKDIIIIFAGWYISNLLLSITRTINFPYTPFLNGYFHLLFLSGERFIFLALIIFYLISFYETGFKLLGLQISRIRQELKPALLLIIIFLVLLLVFVNIPLSYQQNVDNFTPLYEANKLENFRTSLGGLLIIFFPTLLISFSEQFMLNNIIFELFNYRLPSILALLFSSLFFSLLFLNLQPARILLNFLLGVTSIYLYIKAEGSLILPTLFATAFYSFYVCYVFGWPFLQF